MVTSDGSLTPQSHKLSSSVSVCNPAQPTRTSVHQEPAPLISNLGSFDKLGIRAPSGAPEPGCELRLPLGLAGRAPLPRAAPSLFLLLPGSSRSSRQLLDSKKSQASAPLKQLSFSWRFYRPWWIQCHSSAGQINLARTENPARLSLVHSRTSPWASSDRMDLG